MSKMTRIGPRICLKAPLCPNSTKKVQKEVSQIANYKLQCPILLGGLSVNLNHLKIIKDNWIISIRLRFIWLLVI